MAGKSPEPLYRKITETKLKSCTRRPIMLAEKVESESVFEHCGQLGYSLFQGYFLARPEMVFGKKLNIDNQHSLQLVSELQSDTITINAVSEMVKRNTSLSYMLLKIVNSPACRVPKKIESIQEGIVYLGLLELKKWAMVLSLSKSTSTPIELIRLLLERAKTSELFAASLGVNSEQAFTLGLFSGLDLVMHADKQWLLQQIGLSDEAIDAIVSHTGPLGSLLSKVIELEKGELSVVNNTLSPSEKEAITAATSNATVWVNEVLSIISNV